MSFVRGAVLAARITVPLKYIQCHVLLGILYLEQGPWKAVWEFTLIQLSSGVSAVIFLCKVLWGLADLYSKWKLHGMGATK